jgi:hypothetical protein
MLVYCILCIEKIVNRAICRRLRHKTQLRVSKGCKYQPAATLELRFESAFYCRQMSSLTAQCCQLLQIVRSKSESFVAGVVYDDENWDFLQL